MLGYEGKASINEVDQVRQRKGSWPVWIDLQKEGIREIIVLILIYKSHIWYLLRNLLWKRRQHRRMPRAWTLDPHWGLWSFRRRCSLLPGNLVISVELTMKANCFKNLYNFLFRTESTQSGTWGLWEIITLSRQKISLSVLPIFLAEIIPASSIPSSNHSLWLLFTSTKLFYSRLLNSVDSGGRRLTFLETPRPG